MTTARLDANVVAEGRARAAAAGLTFTAFLESALVRFLAASETGPRGGAQAPPRPAGLSGPPEMTPALPRGERAGVERPSHRDVTRS
jgi:hypothetical protein